MKSYIWENVEPDTFKQACKYLMAHKEPYMRNSADAVGTDADEDISRFWTSDEFRVLDTPAKIVGPLNNLAMEPKNRELKLVIPQ